MSVYTEDQKKIWDHFQNEGIDSFSRSRGRLEFLVRKIPVGARALNIGVGNGVLELLALDKGVEIWSLDPSERAIGKLRDYLGMADRAQVGYSQSMPFPDTHFDFVIMSEVLEHLDEPVFEATLNEVHRVLKPNGIFMGTVPARENLADAQCVCPYCGQLFHRWGHKRSFDIAQLSSALATRFSLVKVSERFFIEWGSVGVWRKLQGLVKKLLSWKGIGTYGICRNIFFVVKKSKL